MTGAMEEMRFRKSGGIRMTLERKEAWLSK